ncbi:unnamed protein product [Ceratitis capitata]|uniref:(Mediterranean fruit fly) hypothetical protein n=1 Tax=Ceratitis capitata TaxID=7213 RepID=A0A811VGQ8_CERCA|nr:unnamed protein product [Ceratitis capitata]
MVFTRNSFEIFSCVNRGSSSILDSTRTTVTSSVEDFGRQSRGSSSTENVLPLKTLQTFHAIMMQFGNKFYLLIKALNEENLCPTFKQGGGGVIMWGCKAAGGVGNFEFIEGTMDRFAYFNILNCNLRQSVKNWG